eukprot:CAMPEP_0173383622 /NCGR_PEP_ID=MMETSP1356-20130122/6189_1 /TAXON_ID=77927 ORGANISM="Hemiselmis virescens, Strain PCC157" /NCGR_SAMPLE_ID=MMETSP1356 /ASSEMBLY_ACC=CAM_ASM_000847 /LENGTH=61 /DNA_ID=CAMNT_0014338573 /DNA_START=59 /DNA_END=241 /DNA_ORIENTATION=+
MRASQRLNMWLLGKAPPPPPADAAAAASAAPTPPSSDHDASDRAAICSRPLPSASRARAAS